MLREALVASLLFFLFDHISIHSISFCTLMDLWILYWSSQKRPHPRYARLRLHLGSAQTSNKREHGLLDIELDVPLPSNAFQNQMCQYSSYESSSKLLLGLLEYLCSSSSASISCCSGYVYSKCIWFHSRERCRPTLLHTIMNNLDQVSVCIFKFAIQLVQMFWIDYAVIDEAIPHENRRTFETYPCLPFVILR